MEFFRYGSSFIDSQTFTMTVIITGSGETRTCVIIDAVEIRGTVTITANWKNTLTIITCLTDIEDACNATGSATCTVTDS